MALEGTHIRFALDLKNILKVKNLDKYISGTIYPNSRYITKTDRHITHSDNLLNKEFYKNDDFKKGWIVHLLCDQIQTIIFNEIFSDILKNPQTHWPIKTNLKIFQDMDDIKQFPIKKYLKCLNHTETPNKENHKIIKKYNQIFIDIYKKDKPDIQDYIDMWAKQNLDPKLLIQIKDSFHQINKDKIMKQIGLVYPKMIKTGLEVISHIN